MKFVGAYVSQVKRLLVASAVSGHNAMLISAPGWGKTEMARQAAAKMVGSDHTVVVELDPSTPPEVIHGAYDPIAMREGKRIRIVEGTPYDPAAQIIILDEIWRGNDVVFDALIHATNNKNINPLTRPVFWGTSNFVGKAERTEALRDRFAMWLHMDGDLDPVGIAMAHLYNGSGALDADWTGGMPDWNECLRIRATHPTARAADVVSNTVQILTEEAAKKNFAVNPRRVVQWAEILFRVSVLVTGTEDFDTIPLDASRILMWCYPAIKREQATEWAEVATAVLDSIGAAIESYRALAMEKFEAVVKSITPADKTAKITELGLMLSEVQGNLVRIGGSDERVNVILAEFTDLFQKAVTGQ